MFDLEHHIAAWRTARAQSLGDKSEAIDELESHLREQWHRRDEPACKALQ